jgi:hypothetical protein
MPEGVGYSGSNVVAGAGLDINYVGKHVYAYSGEITFQNAGADALVFTTGNKPMVLNMMVMTNDTDADDFIYDLTLNEVSIAKARFTAIGMSSLTLPIQLLGIVVPPYSNVKLNFKNQTDDTAHTAFAILTGRVD